MEPLAIPGPVLKKKPPRHLPGPLNVILRDSHSAVSEVDKLKKRQTPRRFADARGLAGLSIDICKSDGGVK